MISTPVPCDSAQMNYRPEIDGLRAVAVLAVVLFHSTDRFTGGYVGVDVFFVISGFLITSLIWKDLESGRFTFIGFWERRARRIVPALVVTTIATLVAGWLLLLPADFDNLGQASAAQAAFAANFHYYWDSGYFSGAAEEKPLLHTWSLAVEEQFYLLVPLLLWGMFRSVMLRGRTAVISVLATGFILSLALSVYGVSRDPSATFYLLPTRAWELLLGSLIAFLPASSQSLPRKTMREVSALTGLSLILVSVFFYTPQTPFPGFAALPPCFGAALIIWGNGLGPTVIGSILSTRPVVFVGLISYSLYLWHWPFLAFSKYLSPEPLGFGHRAALVGLGFLFATLSWKYVETPFRKRKLGASRKAVFAFAGSGLAVVLGCGLVCVVMQGFPHRFSAEALKFAAATSDQAFFGKNLTTEDIVSGKLLPIGVQDPLLRPAVFVWGDSFAQAALPAVDALLKERGLAGIAATHEATPPVLDWFSSNWFGLREDSITYNNAVLSNIRSQRVPDVILVANWGWYEEHGDRSRYHIALVKTVQRIVAMDSRAWILLTPPQHSFEVQKALSLSLSPVYIKKLLAKSRASVEYRRIDSNVLAKIEAAGGRILDPRPRFLDPTGQLYIIQADGFSLYTDHCHLSTKGANLMLLPLLRELLTLQTQGIASRK